ncbi:uncharacterized protein NMK_1785 [Novimethylophilus kurashikiensis]|uniref:Uncharacterized protein n=1 Tax=Novimethylophilus kurashikiensis TaxID=1825523 RepID=A0A2R5F7K4_9PROT|nr:hypothetical protein [Novimethylophilus kurashikiensis]GBG14220.1 uncharacterized protein NMK_1785 [Novimethylophilus kurashikiensis]
MYVRQASGGVLIGGKNHSEIEINRFKFLEQTEKLGLAPFVEISPAENGQGTRFWICREIQEAWAPDRSTLNLCKTLQLDTLAKTDDLEKEILVAMLLAPVTFAFPSHDEMLASVRIRQNIVQGARRTALSFHTSKVDRPTEYWRYSEEAGFILVPGKHLIEALRTATQPDNSEIRYSFSCYRATEYVILLGMALELETSNPILLQGLQRQWETRAIMSGRFHDTFLCEYGSVNEPLPMKFYVPGDRLWFRNPDEASSDVSGYEGSWVFYLGNGLFTNFWEPDKPYTLAEKCVELYHWRHAIYTDEEGAPRIDETIVDERVCATMKDHAKVQIILGKMMRLRDSKGVYADGGCIDRTREYPRLVCQGTSDIVLPFDMLMGSPQ